MAWRESRAAARAAGGRPGCPRRAAWALPRAARFRRSSRSFPSCVAFDRSFGWGWRRVGGRPRELRVQFLQGHAAAPAGQLVEQGLERGVEALDVGFRPERRAAGRQELGVVLHEYGGVWHTD